MYHSIVTVDIRPYFAFIRYASCVEELAGHHVSGRSIVLPSEKKKNKKKVFGLVKVTHALALRSSSKQLAVVSVFRALPFYVFSSYGPQSSWFKVHRLEPLTWVPEILFSGRALFPIYFCVHTCTLLLLHTGSMRLAFVTLGI